MFTIQFSVKILKNGKIVSLTTHDQSKISVSFL